MGIATFVLALPAALLGFAGVRLLATDRQAGVALIAVAAGAVIILAVISSALGQVYKTAVYLYATNGENNGYSTCSTAPSVRRAPRPRPPVSGFEPSMASCGTGISPRSC